MTNWAPNLFIDTLYQQHLDRTAKLPSIVDERERLRRKERLAAILRIDPEPQSELNPLVLGAEDCGDFIRERIEISTYNGLRMPLYVLLPKAIAKPLPAVIALHGHGYGSKELVGLAPDGTEQSEGTGIHKHFAVSLVKRGFAVIVPELLGFGERRLEEDSVLDKSVEDSRQSSCYKLSSYLIHLGQSLAGIRTYEVLRAVDYAKSRQEVRAEGVGVMGLSGGAFVAYLAAALDERFSAVVLSGYTNTYKDSYFFERQHCLCDYIPGIVELGDMPDLIGLIAPRPLFLEVGTEDPIFPIHGAVEAAERLKLLYEQFGAADELVLDIFEGKHEISGKRAFDWLSSRLRLETP